MSLFIYWSSAGKRLQLWQDSDMVWLHDKGYLLTLPIEFEINRVDFRPKVKQKSVQNSREFQKE